MECVQNKHNVSQSVIRGQLAKLAVIMDLYV